MVIIGSRNGVPIRLTKERWRHIVARHPEIEGQRDKVLETLALPEVIQAGDFGTLLSARRYASTPVSEKTLVVVYKEASESDGFIVTAYFTDELSKRRHVIWRQ